MKYVARLREVEAVQWWPPGHPWHTHIPGVETGPRGDQGAVLVDRQRVTTVNPGDWIVTTARGRMVMPAALFEALYREPPPSCWPATDAPPDGSLVTMADGQTYRLERIL